MLRQKKKKIMAAILATALLFGNMTAFPSYAEEENSDVAQENTMTEEAGTTEEFNEAEEITVTEEDVTEGNVAETEINIEPESEKSIRDVSGFQGENPSAIENVTEIDENGNVVSVEVEDGNVAGVGKQTRAAAQIVNFHTKSSGKTTNYTEAETGVAGYTYGPYGADAAYLGTSGGKVKFMLGGVIGLVNANEVQVLDKASAKTTSHYYVSSEGHLYHRIATNLNSTAGSTLDNGPAPSYLKAGNKYYSYDGHYFYTEANFGNMLDDYNKKTRSHSVNANNPFYNYFQYLPLRSVSNYSGNSINTILNNRVQPTSKMKNTGNEFVNHQNTYGANALIMTGIAANESAWGMSSIAKNKNNLFGLNAVDSSPGQSANYFKSVSHCIKEFAEVWLSKGYLDPSDGRYFGGFLGNKASGMNVKYASDPYWGEKAAAMAWSMDRANGNKDAYKYTIGIKDTIGPVSYTVNIRNESNTSCKVLYRTKRAGNCAFIILNNTPVNKFYKIQSDGVLNSGRTALDSKTGVYNFDNMYAYMSSDYLKIVHKGNGSGPSEPEPAGMKVNYSTHVQNIGWQNNVSNGATGGTTGKGLRMEAIKIALSNQQYPGNIQYSSHIQNIGWQDWKQNGALSGTEKQSKRLEAIKIKLTGQMAEKYDIYYRVHAQNYGWLGWAKNGAESGTEGFGYRLEAIQVQLVKKGGSAPGTTQNPFVKKILVNYSTHVQNIGWQSAKADGEISGTSGKSLRLEAIKMNLGFKDYSGGIQYSTHVQNIGWQGWKADGAMSGTSGKSLRLEAIKIKLTGKMALYYDVYYRVHAQDYGWLNWAKNGNAAGTEGKSKRLEAIQIQLVKKGGKAPSGTGKAFVK